MNCPTTQNNSSSSAASASERDALLECFDAEHSALVAIAKRIGPDAMDALLEELGGTKPHIPTAGNFWSTLKREVRNEEIRARFHGDNLQQLCLETGMGERQLRNILASPSRQYKRTAELSKAVHVPDSVYDPYANLAAVYGAPVRGVVTAVLEIALEAEEVRQALEERFGGQLQLGMEAA